jgi:hypothetical protein
MLLAPDDMFARFWGILWRESGSDLPTGLWIAGIGGPGCGKWLKNNEHGTTCEWPIRNW